MLWFEDRLADLRCREQLGILTGYERYELRKLEHDLGEVNYE